ncbi:BPSL0067 family protein [Sphingomonas immobilis]|uniref:BPSL0067 family protein n=1 Tax=Sphingomonas immobilis TaxID=3063997 RepID=A0ABT8ZZH5_9SPHN|nr:BPSL0067 family protein [Sphingomonas sp. CA1-15]MDO7842524.1 BPSL0067 family protein [Sphingomonas sp. CA1-15]
MAYIAANYLTNANAPMGQWVCTRSSSLGPFAEYPTNTHSPDFCGQCVSFVTTVCTTIPVSTAAWKKGAQVKGLTTIVKGTAIATFNADGRYSGHAAIYDGQTTTGIQVVDQWVTGSGSPIHSRTLRFGAKGLSNNGDNFYVVD